MKKTKKQELFIDLIAAIDAATIHDSRMYQANNIIHLDDQKYSVHTTLVHNTYQQLSSQS
jgi:hypothetical protein